MNNKGYKRRMLHEKRRISYNSTSCRIKSAQVTSSIINDLFNNLVAREKLKSLSLGVFELRPINDTYKTRLSRASSKDKTLRRKKSRMMKGFILCAARDGAFVYSGKPFVPLCITYVLCVFPAISNFRLIKIATGFM